MEPLPGSLATVTSPPIMRANLRVMARPRPVPPCGVVPRLLQVGGLYTRSPQADFDVIIPRQARHSLFDHSISERECVRREVEVEGLCGFQVDNEFQPSRLFDGKIAGLFAFQY